MNDKKRLHPSFGDYPLSILSVISGLANSPSDFTHYDFRAMRGYELQVSEFDCLARQPRLPLCSQSENDSECCNYNRRDSSQIVAALMNDNPDVGDHKPDAIDGAIIVIGIGFGLALGWYIVATTPDA